MSEYPRSHWKNGIPPLMSDLGKKFNTLDSDPFQYRPLNQVIIKGPKDLAIFQKHDAASLGQTAMEDTIRLMARVSVSAIKKGLRPRIYFESGDKSKSVARDIYI